ncbi:1,6-anhydro-N-acetylmuramyl-L-alanine amidase AmpD [Pleionea sediminis]|uniref:1,6-anhydro-N-acetylmuramyl-L-alanine amidase AmpD n=1 Tax=Pleionea sediminis TaxID=2569479 RepID=UPI0011855048|nr:1,6-anhydro-N-acetylmuramyl-L-alanine amidase AmpD [Pleionea sediminis]
MNYSFVKQCPSPHFNQRPDGVRVNLLVIHNISLPPGEFGTPYVEQFFQGKLTSKAHPFFDEIRDVKVSSHFYIRRSGQVVQFVDTANRAWHAGVSSWDNQDNCNDFSIGIELEGTDTTPYTDAQYESLTSLTLKIQQQYPDIANDRIVGHSDIAPNRKTDPGPSFDWDYFYKLLSEKHDQKN